MQNYIGYGFDVDDLQNEDWLRLMREHDMDEYDCFVEDTKQNYGEQDLHSNLLSEVENRIDDISSLAEYLRDIINNGEREKSGADYIVSAYDHYLLFSSVRFADDTPRSKYIRTQEDFVRMVGRYVPVSELTFANLYDGSDWVDSALYFD